MILIVFHLKAHLIIMVELIFAIENLRPLYLFKIINFVLMNAIELVIKLIRAHV